MKTRTKLITLGLAGLLLFALVPAMVFAQGNPPTDEGGANPMRALIETAADVLGLDPEAFLTALRDGQTPADLAEQNGVSLDSLNGALIDTWNAQGPAVVEQFVNEGPPKPRHDGRPDRRQIARHWLGIAAETVGIDEQAFVEALQAGQTPAEIAEANGSSGQAIVDAIVADAQEHLAQAVADGKLTQEEADARLADLTAKVGEWVENGLPPRPGGPGGPGGPGRPGDVDATGVAAPAFGL